MLSVSPSCSLLSSVRSSFCSSEEDEAIDGGIDSRACTREVVMEFFSLRASMTAKGQWLALWPADLQMEQRRESEHAEATWPSSSQLKQAKLLHCRASCPERLHRRQVRV